jgi:hypothetical protein
MPDFRLEKLGQYGPITIFRVDGEAIRNSSLRNEEFGTNAIHVDFPALIPDNEIWIEDDVPKSEYPYLIANGLFRYKLMLGGMAAGQAYDRALVLEKGLRARGERLNDLRVGWLYSYGQYNVFLVNGATVRAKYKTDFIEGGNHSVYKWIPRTEIWIEAALQATEYPFILGHEAAEDYIMTTFNWDYDRAHKLASLIEYKMRERGEVSLADAIPLAFDVMRKMHISGRRLGRD